MAQHAWQALLRGGVAARVPSHLGAHAHAFGWSNCCAASKYNDAEALLMNASADAHTIVMQVSPRVTPNAPASSRAEF